MKGNVVAHCGGWDTEKCVNECHWDKALSDAGFTDKMYEEYVRNMKKEVLRMEDV